MAIGSKPYQVVEQLFDSNTHNAIVGYLDEFSHVLRTDVDLSQFNRRYVHSHFLFKSIHTQLTDYASEMFGMRLKPSYNFLSMYNQGGRCPLHLDRPQCLRTIDYLVRCGNNEPWELRISDSMTDEERQDALLRYDGSPKADEDIQEVIDSNTWHSTWLKPNDAVLYSGTHSWHYRPTASTSTVDLVFFHFVREDFDGSLD